MGVAWGVVLRVWFVAPLDEVGLQFYFDGGLWIAAFAAMTGGRAQGGPFDFTPLRSGRTGRGEGLNKKGRGDPEGSVPCLLCVYGKGSGCGGSMGFCHGAK